MNQDSHFIITSSVVRDLCAESPRARLLHRLHCIALVAHGLSSSEVARIFGDSPRAVAYWVKRFKHCGIDGLEEESRPGRPSKLNLAQIKKLHKYLNKSKEESKPMKAETLAAYILKEFGVVLTANRCWRILKQFAA